MDNYELLGKIIGEEPDIEKLKAFRQVLEYELHTRESVLAIRANFENINAKQFVVSRYFARWDAMSLYEKLNIYINSDEIKKMYLLEWAKTGIREYMFLGEVTQEFMDTVQDSTNEDVQADIVEGGKLITLVTARINSMLQ